MPSRKQKWKKNFDKRNRDLGDSTESETPSEENQGGEEKPPPGKEIAQGACGTAADEKPDGSHKHIGRWAKKKLEGKMRRHQGRKEASPDAGGNQEGAENKSPTQSGRPASKGASETSADNEPVIRNAKERRNEEQRRGRPSPVSRNPTLTKQNARPLSRGVLPRNSTLDIKTLKDKDETEVAYQLNEKMAQLKFFLQSQERQHNSDEFIFDLICTLAVACRAPPGENTNKILAALKGSAFWSLKIPCLLGRVQASMTLNDPVSRQKLIQCLITVFIKYLTHLPSSYVDLPYVQLKLALDQSSIDRKEQLQKELDTFKQAREEIMRGERQKHGRRYTIRADEKPPNDFRDIPICPTSQEITTQERPFLRKNISKGSYENAEHYLDVQFRLLREDFLEPLREGIHDIVQNVPRQHRKQLITNYCSVRIVSKEFTRSGVIHQVQINVTGLNTSRWAHSKRLLYGSLLCLSNDNFNTMLFATVSKREPEELKKGRIDIQFIEEQDVLGIESRDYVYQMVESPAYFEAYRYVLKGLKKLDETTLPLKKYLVECSAEVDPPEYLRRDDTEEQVCYDLSKALHVGDESTANATAVPVLQPGAWPSVKALPLLNSSQLEAIRTAITTEFSVIQGPPGTGKTYVGAKIVRCLLENRTAWDPLHNSPMLMACYTNHALDQFLEKVLEFLPSEQIIRVGGRSKSEKLEACNLKNFTFQYRLHKKRKEVKEKITQNDREMKTCKNHLVKADEQFLEFKDLEELLNSTHTNQLYNATFPPNEPNECRTPDNAFIMWLCELMGSCNQSPKAKTDEQPDRSQASHDATLSGAPLAADEIDTNKALITGGKLNEDFSEQQELEKSYDSIPPRSLSFQQKGSSLENQPSSNASRANLDVKIEVESVNLATMRLKNVPDSSKITEDPQTEKELRGQSLDKISKCDEETTVKEHQRRRQGDEGLLLATPEETNALKSQVEDRSVSNGKNNDRWTTVSSKVVKLLSCQESESNHTKEESKEAQLLSDENRDEAVTVKSTKKKKKKRRKKNNENNANPKINIAGDIASLNEDLVNEEVVFTDEAIALGEIWTSELSGETVDELNEVEKETIAIEKEADFIQYQRRLQGDEDLLLAISKQTDYSISQEQDQTAISKGNGHGLPTRTHKKKGKTFFWEKEEKRKGSQARKELNGESVDEIRTLDEETIEQQYQKRTQVDEDLLLAISEQAEDPRVSNEENENGWVTLSSEKGSPFFWQESESNHSKEESKEAQLLSDENRDEALTVKSTKKKQKKRTKNKEHNENPQINITGDIASLNEDLVNEEMVFTDEAIGLAEIWSLEPRKDFSKKGLSGETVDELNDADKGTIARERDTDFIQCQRRVQSDEDPLRAVSKQTDYSISQEQDQPAINKENDDGLTTMTHRKKGKTFFWQEKEERRGSQTRKELSGESVDEIRTLDEETIEQQYQKRTQGDEDLLLAISEQAEDQRVPNEENENGWVTLSSTKVSPFSWQESESNHSKGESKEAQLLSDENRDEALAVKSTKKKKKKRKKNKEHNENPQINITGDIASLNEDLIDEEMVLTDEVIGIGLDPRKDFSKKELSGETVDETTAIEREAGLTQCQQCIQADDDLLLSMSEQTDYIISQEQDQSAVTNGNDNEWMTVSHKKKGKGIDKKKGKGKTFFWEENEGSKGAHASKKTGKKSIQNNEYIKKITYVREALKGEEMMTSDEVMGVDDIWSLSQSDRLRLYLFWFENYRERYRVEIQRGEQEYERLSEELQAVTFEEEEQVIRQAAVVGMTTSGAARYHSVLQRVAPRIVVIEEAAEVMEAHIITSLSHNTKHTILIGDHKQLRPKATVYALAQKYNLEVSLFERMVMNNIDCKQLSIQHRMRPEIAALTKRIYDHEIIDHESVCHFPDISGVCHNMFFIDHCQPETLIGGLQSYSNPHEAAFLVALCTYLQLQGYERRQITVLTMYTGQLLVLQECMPRENFEGVKVCAVDNFQGEENDIILLSLVRSNSEGRIGFLGESNRICVALSRARKGFYCIGNFSLLKNQSALWKEICDDLTTKGAIGDCLELVCKSHSNATRVRSASDFNRLGGCNMPCGFRLQCGHACDKQCHASSHKKVKCLKMCPTRCPNEHQCQSVCHHPINCPPCSIKMSKTVPKCGHKQPVRCHVDPAKFSCRLKCEKVLQCGHRCDRACGVSCTAHCQVNCTKTLSCGHKKDMPCYRDPMLHTKCNGKCEKLLDCGHPCSKRCKEQCQCNTEIEITLACEHTKRVLCRTKNNPNQCKEKCSRKLECGHDCTGSCHEDCRTNKCKIDVVKVLRCGHQQSVPCYQDPETAFCYAPCPRRLDCGHKCSSVCGRQCHEVQCKELCQIKCDRGHSCQKRCGTSCGDCMVEVTMIIPACGHSSNMPCCVDPASLKCKRPCEKERICGHPCPEICGKKCEARPCKVYVSRTLSCDHVVSLPCHKNPDKFICKEKVEVRLTCGHKTLLECHVSKTRLEKVLCKRKVEKELRCKHKLTLPCFKNPEDCPCRKHVNVKLPCGHMKAIVCSAVLGGLQNVSCMVKVPRTLPCNHEATLPCRVRSQEYYCQEEVEITLSCGHNKLTVCSSKRDELQGGICDRKVTRKLPCGHEKDTKCSDKPYMIFCDVPCERFLSCGHLCPNKCGDNCARSRCAVRVKKDLPCGYHKVGCLCADDVSQIICSNQCTQKLMCGHQCPGKCSKKCSLYKCQKIVVKNLNCVGNHSRKMPCSADTSSIACQERCTRNLDCGHPCPGLCSEPCEKTKCMQRVEKTYPCGHREQLQCFESKTATCKAPCRRRESCKHVCKGVCGVPCSNYLCDVAVSKTLTCGHKITLPCSYSVDEVECSEPCGTKLQCGHQCSGSCNECQRRGSHEMCQHPCGRPLVCSHRCRATCSTPCPPCIRKCSRRCPHGKCTRLCFESCYPTNNSKQQHACTKPCTWSCPHYQCNNLCGEECDRPRCDASCPKKLACRHPCIGLCGENCPTVCATCHAKKLSSMLGGGRAKLTEGLRYLQLFDCGHIVNVEEMDAWMLRELERDVQLIQCPRCSTAITFSYRYGNVIKMTLKNTENVKANIRQLGNETANFVSGLVRRLRHPSEGIRTTVKKLSRHPNSYALDNVHPIRFPFLFTLKNHLLIMHQIEKALFSLENVTKHQTSLNWQLEVKKHSDTIKDALDKITKYLKKRQLDLRTLDQLHEHTRKFSLFASILEAQSKAIRRQKTLSSIAQTRLKMADKGFRLFLQGNDDALHTDWLERIVDLLRKEVGLEPLQPEEPKEFENFPGFSKGVWKLCEHGQVYFTSWIVCDGEEVNAVSNGCEHCVETEDSD